MHWVFENTGFHSGVFNMDYDIALARALVQGIGNPTIRIYGWLPPAISIGWNQSFAEIDSDRAKIAGVDIVRRPTGGRAILHSDELTYSTVFYADGRNTLSVYKEISKALVIALEQLGIGVSIQKSQIEYSMPNSQFPTASCFSSISMYEIKWQGRKIIGSAQRRYLAKNGDEVVLQHGAIPLSSDYVQIVDFLSLDSEIKKEDMKRRIRESSVDLSTALNRCVTFNEVADAILYGFEKAWSIKPEVKDFIEEQKVNL